jgi:ParB family chromosome partitioning protein
MDHIGSAVLQKFDNYYIQFRHIEFQVRMEVKEIDINLLHVSELNVRKVLTSEEDETGISDLANDIQNNGLINPITVRKIGVNYEIIAGQRRYLACKMLNRHTIPCSIVDVSTQKAEELSLVENIQRNPMTNSDKIKTYNKLYNVYNKDIDKVIHAVNISRITLNKYIKLGALPEDIIKLLDITGEEKLTIDVAVELTKLPESTNKLKVLEYIKNLTSSQKVSAIKEFIRNKYTDAEDIDDIKNTVIAECHDIKFVTPYPYVLDENKNKVKIPENLFANIITLIKSKTGGVLEYV